MDPLISVVVCVRDGARWLAPALRSVLEQTHSHLELVVVDDGSRDETPTILSSEKDPRLVVRTLPESRGPFVAANLGLALAQGEFLARLDADDLAFPSRLQTQLAAFRARPELGLVGTACTRLDESGESLGAQQVPFGADVALRAALQPPFVHSSVMWRRALGLRYDESLTVGGDAELWSRALLEVPADNVPQPLVGYREWAGSLSTTRRAAQAAVHAQVAWMFVSTRWPKLARFESEHRALRTWAARATHVPMPSELRPFIDALLTESGGRAETLHAPLGTLGQPRHVETP